MAVETASQEDFDEGAARAAAHGAVLSHLRNKLQGGQLPLTASHKVQSVTDLPVGSSHASNIPKPCELVYLYNFGARLAYQVAARPGQARARLQAHRAVGWP